MGQKSLGQPKRVPLYARVSTLDKGQDRAANRPETQLRPLREYAGRRGFQIQGEYVDTASGTTEGRCTITYRSENQRINCLLSFLTCKIAPLDEEPPLVGRHHVQGSGLQV